MTAWVLQASEAVDVIYYTEKAAGIVPVQKMRYEWHPERITPFLKTLPRKTSSSFRKSIERFHRRSAVQGEESKRISPAGFRPLRLKNGSEVYGRILEEREGVVWVEVEGGKVSFKKEEIVTSAP